MQLRKMTLMLAVLGAMSMVLTGCPDGGRDSLTCSADADCLESEICHPTAKVCVQTCTTTADCPESAKKCEALSSTNTQMICKCSTSELCARDERVTDVELACDTTTQVCVPKCTADTDCAAGQTCDTTAGVCKSGTTGTTCDPNTQPGICGYGQVCSSATSKCEAAPQGTCSQATGAPTWVQTGSSAPVIVSVTASKLSTTDKQTQCGDGGPAGLVTIRFYAPGGLTAHTVFSDLQKHVKAKLNASASFIGPSFASKEPVANATAGDMVVGFCGPATATGAIYIANEDGKTSNVVCTSW
jgi:Cys-rich repeat protein